MSTTSTSSAFPAEWAMTPGTDNPDRFTGRRPWDAGDGYDFMHEHAIPAGWRAVASWGRDGWDLGDWPYVCIFFREHAGSFYYLCHVEGDLTGYRFDTLEQLHAHTDGTARFYWEHDRDRGPDDLDSPDARGPFSWARLDAAKGTA